MIGVELRERTAVVVVVVVVVCWLARWLGCESVTCKDLPTAWPTVTLEASTGSADSMFLIMVPVHMPGVRACVIL